MFPKLLKSGVQTVFMQLFLGSNPIKSYPTLDKDLVLALRHFPGSNRVMFGMNSEKRPEPKSIKQMILIDF